MHAQAQMQPGAAAIGSSPRCAALPSRAVARRSRTSTRATPEYMAELLQLAAATATPDRPLALPPSVPTISPGAASSAVDQAVANAIELIKTAGKLAEGGIQNAQTGAQYAKQAYDRASPYVNKASDTALPYLKSGAQTATDVATPLLKQLQPLLQGGVGEAERFLNQQGLNLNSSALVDSTRQAREVAGDAYVQQGKPLINRVVDTVTTSSPGVLAEYVVAALAVYYLGPGVLRTLFRTIRGYRGGITPAAALDCVCNEGNTVIVDIRTDREKGSSGVPDIPNSGRLISVEYASVTDRKLRGNLRNVSDIEKQMTILEVASLKRVGKGTKILILDSNGGGAKDVARGLSGKGFRNVFVVQGGFSGWTSSKLQTKASSSVSDVQILGPLFGSGRTGGGGGKNTQRRALPSGR